MLSGRVKAYRRGPRVEARQTGVERPPTHRSRRKSRSAREHLVHREDHLGQPHGAVDLVPGRGPAEHQGADLIIRAVLEQSGFRNFYGASWAVSKRMPDEDDRTS